MSTKYKNNTLPISVKGKKKLLAPLNNYNNNNKNNNNNKSVISTSTKDSLKENIKESESKKNIMYTTREKFELDCDTDKKDDAIFLSQLNEKEKKFYEVNAKAIYDFLKSINLIRYIDSFITDGFETKEDLMEIQEDYFEENKNFNKTQQKKILSKAKEYLKEYNEKFPNNIIVNNNNNEIIKNQEKKKGIGVEMGQVKNEKKVLVEMGVGGGDVNEYLNNMNSINRCWTCFNKLKEKNVIEIKYKESIVTRIVRFCSEKCKNKFEENIYTICDNCCMKYDKSKGDFIYKNYHFHSQKCLDDYLKKNNFDKEQNFDSNINEDNYSYINERDNENNIYDPMNDF